MFPEMPGSKSAALLIGDGIHHLLWGDTVIRIANSTNITHWPDIGPVLLAPRPDRQPPQPTRACA